MPATRTAPGPAFTGITDLRTSAQRDGFWARVGLPAAAQTPPHRLRIHPVLLDLCAQLVVAGLIEGQDPDGQDQDHGLVPPVRAGRVRLLGDPAAARYGHTRISRNDAEAVVGHVLLLDEEGKPIAAIDDLHFARHAPGADSGVDRWYLETGWHPLAVPETAVPEAAGPATAGNWLVIGEADGFARVLADALRAGGAAADVLDAPVGADPLDRLRQSLTPALGRPLRTTAGRGAALRTTRTRARASTRPGSRHGRAPAHPLAARSRPGRCPPHQAPAPVRRHARCPEHRTRRVARPGPERTTRPGPGPGARTP